MVVTILSCEMSELHRGGVHPTPCSLLYNFGTWLTGYIFKQDGVIGNGTLHRKSLLQRPGEAFSEVNIVYSTHDIEVCSYRTS